jgi:hypothetical protein
MRTQNYHGQENLGGDKVVATPQFDWDAVPLDADVYGRPTVYVDGGGMRHGVKRPETGPQAVWAAAYSGDAALRSADVMVVRNR